MMTKSRPSAHKLSAQAEAMIDANVDLVSAFMSDAFDDPLAFDGIPDDATLVLLPWDRPDLARANLEAARREANQGKKVTLRVVSTPKADQQSWAATQIQTFQFKTIRPRWPDPSEGVVPKLRYYQDTDLLHIAIVDDGQSGLPMPWLMGSYLLIDPETQVVLGYVFPAFVANLSGKAHQSMEWLRQAEFLKKTPPDLAQFAPESPPDIDEHASVERVREEVGDLALVS